MANITVSQIDPVVSVNTTDNTVTVNSTTNEFVVTEGALNLDFTQINLKLQQYSETVVALGNQSGVLRPNLQEGSIFTATLTGDITDIQFANVQSGSSATVFMTQGGAGGHNIVFGSLSNWDWVNEDTVVPTDPGDKFLINVVYDGSRYRASLLRFKDIGFGELTTDDLTEGSTNLYYTEERVGSYLTGNGQVVINEVIDDRMGNLIQTTGNITGTYDDASNLFTIGQSLTTDDITEGSTNLFLNGAGTTDNLTEGTANLYYTNARVLAYIVDNGLDFNEEKVDDRVANLIQVSGNLTVNYDDANGTLTVGQALTTDDVTEGTNLYYTDGRFDTRFATKSTTNLTEGTNLYYTDARVNTAIGNYNGSINTSGDITANAFIGDGSQLTGVVSEYGNAQVAAWFYDYETETQDFLNTGSAAGKVIRGKDILLKAFDTGTSTAGDITLDGVVSIASTINGMQILSSSSVLNVGQNGSDFTLRVRRTFQDPEIKYDLANDQWIFRTGGSDYVPIPLSTTDLAEGANLYYTDERVNAAIANYNGSISTLGSISASSLSGDGSSITGITVDASGVSANTSAFGGVLSVADDTIQKALDTIDNVTTTSIPEGTNLYYTDGRFDTRFATKTTTDLTEGTNLYYTTARANAAITTYLPNTNVVISSDSNISTTANIAASAITADTININNGNAFLTWNATDNTVDLAYDATGVVLQLGQEQHLYVRSTEAISNGDVVMFAGAQGDRILVAKADLNSVGFVDDYVVGIATQDFGIGTEGYVTTFGSVRDIDTQTPGWQLGDILYLSDTTPGALTNVEPQHGITVAAVQKIGPGGSGIIFCRPTFGKADLSRLHDVNLGTLADNQALVYDSASGFWQNETLTTSIITEGTNLYFTTARANAAIADYDGSITTTGTITANQFIGDGSQLTGLPSGYTDDDANAAIAAYQGSINTVGDITANAFIGDGSQLTGIIAESSYANADVANYLANSANVTIGDLIVTNNTSIQNSLDITSNVVQEVGGVSYVETLVIDRGTSPEVSIRWNETTDKWQYTNDGTTFNDFGSGSLTPTAGGDAEPSTTATTFAQTFLLMGA